VKIQKPDYTLTYKNDEETRNKVFNRVIKYFLENESYSGESIYQMDQPQIDAIELVANLADEIIKFKHKWKE